MLFQGLLTVVCFQATLAFPMKLLRVPKIYNALITTKQNLLPSEAFPASTGPVFQPLELSGDPVLLNPEAFMKKDVPLMNENAPRPFSKADDNPVPIVFYPRYNIYHQLPQSLYPYSEVYQPPPLVLPVQRSEPQRPVIKPENESEKAPSTAEPETAPRTKAAFGFVTNNSPENGDIPNVPPPPPPMGAPRTEDDRVQVTDN